MKVKREPLFLRRKGLRWRILVPAVAGLILLVVTAVYVVTLGSGPQLKAALETGQFAKLPKSATGVQADGSGDARATTYYVRFAAPAADIETFIRESPSIRWVTPDVLGPERMYLPRGAPASATASATQPARHLVFDPEPRHPWFDPTVRGRGRRWVVPKAQEAAAVEVIVDDEANVVFIRVARG